MASMICPVAVVLICLGGCLAYPTGAPTRVCDSMTPGHGSQSTSANPYSITTSVSQYTPGSTVKVSISGAFQGILLQVRAIGSTAALGTFSNFPVNTKGLSCGRNDSSVTHSSTALKTGADFTWTVPSDLIDEIEFVATIAPEPALWWRNTKSAPLSLYVGDGNDSTREGVTNYTSRATTISLPVTSSTGSSTSPGAITFSSVTLVITLAVSIVGINTPRM